MSYVWMNEILMRQYVRCSVYAPSAISFADDYPNPKALSTEELDYVEKAFLDAVERCKKIGCTSSTSLIILFSSP